jgi:hypothetical protein
MTLIWRKIRFGLAVLQSLLQPGYRAGRILVVPRGRMIERNTDSLLKPVGYRPHCPQAQGHAPCN